MEVAENTRENPVSIDDDTSLFSYNETTGKCTSFTLPIVVKDGETDITDKVAIFCETSGVTVSDKVVSGSDNIERNTSVKLTIRTRLNDSNKKDTTTELYIQLNGKKNNNVDYYTMPSMVEGLDGNKWYTGEGEFKIQGNEYTEEEDVLKYKLQINREDLAGMDELIPDLTEHQKKGNKEVKFYVQLDYGLCLQREYFGVDSTSPSLIYASVNEGVAKNESGIFSNDDITLTVNASDINLYDILLFDSDSTGDAGNAVDSQRVTMSERNGEGYVTFTLDKDTYKNKYNTLYVVARDCAGLRDVKPLSELIEGVNENILIIEEDGPEVNVVCDSEGQGVNSYVDSQNRLYLEDDVVVNVSVTDIITGADNEEKPYSGIKSYDVMVNDDESNIIHTELDGIERTGTSVVDINTEDYSEDNDGVVKIKVYNICDYAGNDVEDREFTIYIDKENAPEASFKSVYAYGKETKYAYGNFYNEKVKYEFNVSDDLSGVNSVALFIGNKNISGSFDTESGIASYEIPKEIKGEAVLKVRDNVGNYTEYSLQDLSTNEYSFSDSYVVVEAGVPVVTIDTDRKEDSDGKWFNGEVSFVIKASDKETNDSGLKEIHFYLNDTELTDETIVFNSRNQAISEKKIKLTNEMINRFINENDTFVLEAVVTDNAGNTKSCSKQIYLDKEAPVIKSVTGVSENSYNQGIVTVFATVTEKNYGEKNNRTYAEVTRELDGNIIKEEITADAANSFDNVSRFVFKEEGTYNVVIKSVDAAGNAALEKQISFTIDNVQPICNISGVTENQYYQDNVTMVLDVTESNFATNNVSVKITKVLNGVESEVAAKTFDSTSKTSKMTQVFNEEGTYTVVVNSKDAAGNEAVTRTVVFTVDTNSPTVTISGVEDGHAYKGDVVPSISINDNYYSSYSVELKKTGVYMNGTVLTVDSIIEKDVTSQFIGNITMNSNGGNKTFDTFDKIRTNDGVYTLTVSATDLSGKTTTNVVKFSLNRYGSVYTYDQELANIMDTYNKSITTDFTITEYNADVIDEDSLIVRVFRDGLPIDNPVYTSSIGTENEAVGESGWYQHTYVISKDNFKLDGVYAITVSTQDAAGNYSENISYDSHEIRFSVDTTKPKLVKVIGLSENSFNADKIDVTYEVFDSISVKEVRVYVNSKLVQKVDEFENVTKYEGVFTIDEGMNQSIRFEVEDMAGNSISSDDEEDNKSGNVISFTKVVTVSENFFVRWYANKVAFIATIGGVVLLIGGTVVFFRKRKSLGDKNIF